MPTENKKGIDFPVSPEQMKWPFRTPEEQKKIIAWAKKQRKRDNVNTLEDVELAPF